MPYSDNLFFFIGTIVILLPIGLSIFDKWNEWEATLPGKILPIVYGAIILAAFAVKCK